MEKMRPLTDTLDFSSRETSVKKLDILDSLRLTATTSTASKGQDTAIRKKYKRHTLLLKIKRISNIQPESRLQNIEEPTTTAATTDSEIVNDKKYTCELCNARFRRKYHVLRHMSKHSVSRPATCTICSKQLKSDFLLDRHMSNVHSDNVKRHPCDQCDYQAKSKTILKKHKIYRHSDVYEFPCHLCNHKFKTQARLKYHVKDHATGPCVCDVCGVVYSTRKSLANHCYDKHTTTVRNYPCDLCKKRFVSQENLERHRKLHEIKYACRRCGREFKNQDHLTRHVQNHSSERSHPCPVCGKSFTLTNSMKVHMLTHTGERPYVCDVCGKSFTQRTPMVQHRKKQHPEVTDAPPAVQVSQLVKNAERKDED